jgi:hypothetical protein
MQTPKLWGYSLEQYLLSKNYSGTSKFDPIFHLPVCNNQTDCGALSKCEVANFSLDKTKLCLMPEHDILNNIATNIENAQYSVDIIQLGNWGITTGEFTETIKNALYSLALKSKNFDHKVSIRILEGSLVPFTSSNNLADFEDLPTLYNYIRNLTKNLPQNNQLIISVATQRSCDPFFCTDGPYPFGLNISWNHGKLTSIDNQKLITGGENYWGEDYLGNNPVSDSMIAISGPIAKTATIYANVLWNYVENNKGFSGNYCYTYTNNQINNTCLVNTSISPNPNIIGSVNYHHDDGDIIVQAMSVNKLNHKVLNDDADQSEIARVYVFKNATKSIKISQQAIFSKLQSTKVLPPIKSIDGDVIESLAYAIHKNNVDVSIITSYMNGEYTSYVPLSYIRDQIKNSIILQFPSMPISSIDHELKLLHLAETMYFNKIGNTDNKNINKITAGTVHGHNKFWMVDDHIFYFGSHNIYASTLQEYGIILDSYQAAERINLEFWNPMWDNSNQLAE